MTSAPPSTSSARPIRSFNARRGRVRPSAARALAQLWSTYGIDFTDGACITDYFTQYDDVALEIGCGNGEASLDYALRDPDTGLLAVDVHRPGLGVLIRDLAKADATNVRVACLDAVELLHDHVPADYFAAVRIFFPDPWQKTRHNKRRLISLEFLELLAHRMRPGAQVHLATDWAHYAEQMRDVVNAAPAFDNPTGTFCPTRPPDRTLTRFERKGLTKGHQVFDIVATRV